MKSWTDAGFIWRNYSADNPATIVDEFTNIDTSDLKNNPINNSILSVSADQKGLAKLPTAVRNKMGYQKKGGSVKRKYSWPLKKLSQNKIV